MEYNTAERKKELLAFVTTWMELETMMLSEVSQVVKDKYCMMTYKLKLINKTNKQGKSNQRH